MREPFDDLYTPLGIFLSSNDNGIVGISPVSRHLTANNIRDALIEFYWEIGAGGEGLKFKG